VTSAAVRSRLEFELPSSIECRTTVLNMLRVTWMDVFECAGWVIVSMWHANSRATNTLDPAGADGAGDATPDAGADAATAVRKGDFQGECANFLLKRAVEGQQAVPSQWVAVAGTQAAHGVKGVELSLPALLFGQGEWGAPGEVKAKEDGAVRGAGARKGGRGNGSSPGAMPPGAGVGKRGGRRTGKRGADEEAEASVPKRPVSGRPPLSPTVKAMTAP
jgi:hypothetical protein